MPELVPPLTPKPITKIRVLIVEDSLTVRKRLLAVLSADPELEVAGEAADGKQAIELCRTLRPDVVSLDMNLPVLSGLAVTEYVMAQCPTPILIVSASTNRGELFKTYEALNAGAVDVFEKPSGESPSGEWERGLASALKMAARIKVITHLRGRLGLARQPAYAALADEGPSEIPKRLIAIGGSTGGPAAVAAILRKLPEKFPIPILLVVHIGESFSSAFADWLDGQSALRVRHAQDGEPLPTLGQSGVWLAPAGFHLIAHESRLRLTLDGQRNSCRPSVDVLFESLAQQRGAETAACLLTGMGKDGAAGLLALHKAGALTLVQDESSCVVFGMPAQAISLGAVDRVLNLAGISAALASLAYSLESRRLA